MFSLLITGQFGLFLLLCFGSLVYVVSKPLNGSGDYNSDVSAAMQRYISKYDRIEKEKKKHHNRYDGSSGNEHRRYNTTICHHNTDLFPT